MANSYIEFRKFTVHKSGDPKEKEILNSFGPDDVDLLDVLYRFLNVQDPKRVIVYEKRNCDIDMSLSDKRPVDLYKTKRVITGLGLQGRTGERRDIWESEASINEDPEFNQKPGHSSRTYFYYLLYIPYKSKEGFAIFQKRGNESIARSLEQYLSRSFNELNPDYLLNFEPFFPKKIVETWLEEGNIKRVTAFKRTHKNQLESKGLISENDVKVRVTFTTRGGFNRTKSLKQLLKKNEFGVSGSVFNALGIQDDFYHHSVQVEYNGQQKEIHLGADPGSSTSIKIEDEKWEDHLLGYKKLGREIEHYFSIFIERPLKSQ